MSEAERTKWEERYRNVDWPQRDPAPFVVAAVAGLAPGTALDVAGGTGRHSVYLASQGWDVTLVDIAPTAVRLAAERAEAAGCSIRTQCLDLDAQLPRGGPWDLVVIHRYLNRGLLAALPHLLIPGGRLVMSQLTVENRDPDDAAPLYLLRPGELAQLLTHLEIESYFEGWTDDDRHEAQVVARWAPAAQAARSDS